jgi:hypothetical protein
MKRLIMLCLSVALAASLASEAFAWGSVSGPRGGTAYRGPMGGAAVSGPKGGTAVRGPAGGAAAVGPNGGTAYRPPSGGAYYGGAARPYYPGAAVATGVAVGVAATAYRPPAYYSPPVVVAPPPCGYYPYPPC